MVSAGSGFWLRSNGSGSNFDPERHIYLWVPVPAGMTALEFEPVV